MVLSGLDPFAEDYLESICVGDARLTLVKPCTRCQITTTDQETGAVGVEPLPTLARTRFNAGLGGVTFGVNAIVSRGAGTRLRRGSRVELTWRF